MMENKAVLLSLEPLNLATIALALPNKSEATMRRLSALCGVKIEELGKVFELAHLVKPGTHKGHIFPMKEAKRAAESFQVEGRRIVCIGRGVAWSFGLRQLQPFVWAFYQNTAIAYIPHPSGANIYYNDGKNWERAKAFMTGLVSDLRQSQEAVKP